MEVVTQKLPQDSSLGQMRKPPAKPKIFIITFFVVLLLIATGGILIIRAIRGSKVETEDVSPTPFLPPADPNIRVDLKPQDPGRTVLLTISGYSTDVDSIEYELVYNTSEKQEGVFGEIKLQVGERSVSREITLGTCSSGVCRYHTIPSGKGTLTLKFTTKKGASRFQKEFNLL